MVKGLQTSVDNIKKTIHNDDQLGKSTVKII